MCSNYEELFLTHLIGQQKRFLAVTALIDVQLIFKVKYGVLLLSMNITIERVNSQCWKSLYNKLWNLL